jgi:hypothetical protein
LLTERSIINFLIWVAGLILGPYLLGNALWGNFTPLLVVGAAAAIFCIFRVARDKLCIAPVVGYAMGGHVNFLPGKLGYSEIGLIVVIGYYLIAYTALKRSKVMTGPLYFIVPIAIVTLIVFYHDHTAATKMTGGGRMGGRGPIFLMLGTVAYVCGVSMNSPSPQFLARTPIIFLVLGTLAALPYVITTYLPGTAPVLYMFSDNVNVGSYVESINDTGEIVRASGGAVIGIMLSIVLLSYFPIYTWWRPNRWWVAIVCLICTLMVILGGYRNEFVTYALMVGVAIACYSGWRVLLMIPALALVIVAATSIQNAHLVNLPLTAQRTLSFLPGDWDPEVASSAVSSNDFRRKISEVYMREEAFNHPLLGDGLTFDAAEFGEYSLLAQTQEIEDGYYSTKMFLAGKMFHIGWISLYDAVGLIGSAAYVFFVGSLIWVNGRMVFSKFADRGSILYPLKVWMFCNILPPFIGFFTVFGDFKTAFPCYCAYTIVLVHLSRLERFGYRPDTGMKPVPFDPERAKLPEPASA